MTPPAGYTLVFSDDFNGLPAGDLALDGQATGRLLLDGPNLAALALEVPGLDLAKWRPTASTDFRGYGQEIWDPTHVSVVDGCLVLSATADLHSGEVRSVPKFGYGYYECRAQLPATPGFWPAFWTLSSLGTYQEIDVAECDSAAPRAVGMNLHWGTAANHPADNFTYPDPLVDYTQAFHTFACLYGPDSIQFFVDDVLRRAWLPPSPGLITDPMEVRLSLSIFGSAQTSHLPPGPATVWPGRLRVDWVRVWQMVPETDPEDPGRDVESPAVRIVSPPNGARVPRRAHVAVLAEAADNVGVQRVEFRVNNALTQTRFAAPYTFELLTSGKPNAAYRVDATAFDLAGNRATATITVRSL